MECYACDWVGSEKNEAQLFVLLISAQPSKMDFPDQANFGAGLAMQAQSSFSRIPDAIPSTLPARHGSAGQQPNLLNKLVLLMHAYFSAADEDAVAVNPNSIGKFRQLVQ